jgi:hypothetical protein
VPLRTRIPQATRRACRGEPSASSPPPGIAAAASASSTVAGAIQIPIDMLASTAKHASTAIRNQAVRSATALPLAQRRWSRSATATVASSGADAGTSDHMPFTSTMVACSVRLSPGPTTSPV